jgi:hypothetical protein
MAGRQARAAAPPSKYALTLARGPGTRNPFQPTGTAMYRPASLLLAAAITLALAACKPAPAPDAGKAADSAPAVVADSKAADAKFADLSKRWLDGMLALSPVSATQVGDHRFDGEVDDMSAAGRAKALEFSKKMLAELEAMDLKSLSRENQVDASVLRNQLRYDVWTSETLQPWA